MGTRPHAGCARVRRENAKYSNQCDCIAHFFFSFSFVCDFFFAWKWRKKIGCANRRKRKWMSMSMPTLVCVCNWLMSKRKIKFIFYVDAAIIRTNGLFFLLLFLYLSLVWQSHRAPPPFISFPFAKNPNGDLIISAHKVVNVDGGEANQHQIREHSAIDRRRRRRRCRLCHPSESDNNRETRASTTYYI